MRNTIRPGNETWGSRMAASRLGSARSALVIPIAILCALGLLTWALPENSTVVTANLKISKGQEVDLFRPPAAAEEALSQAILLHETIQGALRVMHRDFFDDENPDVLPSQSLEDVFAELAKQYQVRLRWLTVDGDEMSVHHRAESVFEREAVKKISAGAQQHSALVGDRFEYVGRIRLVNQCLKCHVRQRLNLDDRSAGLGISIPINPGQ